MRLKCPYCGRRFDSIVGPARTRRGRPRAGAPDTSAVDAVGGVAPELDSFPTFELCYRFDDLAELTVFPAHGDEITTTWITVDADHALPLEAVR